MYKKFTELLFRRHPYAQSNFHLKMKLTVILIVVAVIQLKAETFAQKISVNVSNARLTEVIAQLKKQTDYDFLYNNEVIKNVKPVTLNIKNANLKDVLDRCFSDQPVSYSISNKTVLIMARPTRQPGNNDYREQKLRITGTVTDETNGEPLIGASVVVEGTTTGARTDEKGFFTLDAPGPDVVLVISYVGFQTQKVPAGGQTTLQVKLARSDARLGELVVVGYGSRTKGSITGAITTVKSDVFESGR